MNVMLAINNVYTDHTSGAAVTMMRMMEWLVQYGHHVQVLSTARFDGAKRNYAEHLTTLGVAMQPMQPAELPAASAGRWENAKRPDTGNFFFNGVDVRVVSITRQETRQQTAFEMMVMVAEMDRLITDMQPDLVVSYGGGRGVQSLLRRASERGVKTLFTLHNFGYDDPTIYRYVDHIWSCSDWLARHYREKFGIESVSLPCPITWRQVKAAKSQRSALTMVNPVPPKGLAMFCRIADMLRTSRPDIPILVVHSAGKRSVFDEVLPFEPSEHPNFEVMQAVPVPADFYAKTKVLLVPSAFREPFGRVAAEAMINGIPAIVSNRGALPEVIGDGGVVLPLPEWMGAQCRELPGEDEARPWVDNIIALFDDEEAYASVSQRAYAQACKHYRDDELMDRYDQYFRGLVTHDGA